MMEYIRHQKTDAGIQRNLCDEGHRPQDSERVQEIWQGSDGSSKGDDRLRYILDLSRKSQNSLDEIGFIPKPRLKEYLKHNQIWLSYENKEPCGFLVFGKGWPYLRIYQALIQYDARRKYHCLNLVKKLIIKAISENYLSISLWCANDLEANIFWKSAGFQFVEQKNGGKRRGRKLNRWVIYLDNLLSVSEP